MEIVFFIIWVLFIFFAGKGKNMNAVRDVFGALKNEIEKSQHKKTSQGSGRGSVYTPQSKSTSADRSRRKKSSPWQDKPETHATREAHLDAIHKAQREQQRAEWVEAEATVAPPLSREQSDIYEKTSETKTHSADVNNYVGDIIEERRRERERPTRAQALVEQTPIRDAFLLKELLDKPVSLRD